jgi:molybdopterin synthase sulfur carrier subunit
MIDVLFFGRVADRMGQRRTQIDLPAEGLSLLALRARLFADDDDSKVLMSVNQVIQSGDQALRDGDEVAFFSVFSGG